MYGTVNYFSDYLTSSLMNRLVDEHAASLKDCYEQLTTDIKTSDDNKEAKVTYLKNLDTAYTHVIDHLMGAEEAK